MFEFSQRLNLVLIFFLLSSVLQAPAAILAREEIYRIGREDVLEITVWQSADLTKMVTVNSKGTIPYPFLGDLYVAGKSPQEVEAVLTEKLSQGYVKDPQVSVSVKEYNSKKILVFGEVAKPGLYKLKSSIPLLEVLFMVGGIKGVPKRMTIIRPPHVTEDAIPTQALAPSIRGRSKKEKVAQVREVNLLALLSKGDLSQNVTIRPGDTLYVSGVTGEKYYVLGQVKKPGPYEWTEEISVLEAIKLADGASETAALNRIQIRRGLDRNSRVIKVNVMDIAKGKKKDDVFVRPGDVVIVPESWI